MKREYISPQKAKALTASMFPHLQQGKLASVRKGDKWYNVGYVIPHGYYMEPAS